MHIGSGVLICGVDEIVQKHIFLQSLGPPPERNHRSYFKWIRSKKPLGKGYYDYIYHATDFVKTSGTNSNYFEELIRGHIDQWRGSPIRVRNPLMVARNIGIDVEH